MRYHRVPDVLRGLHGTIVEENNSRIRIANLEVAPGDVLRIVPRPLRGFGWLVARFRVAPPSDLTELVRVQHVSFAGVTPAFADVDAWVSRGWSQTTIRRWKRGDLVQIIATKVDDVDGRGAVWRS